MSFSSPSSFACSCAPMKYCGLRNETRHGSPSAAEVCPAFTEQHLSCCELLFYCFISKPAQAPWLFYKAGICYTCLLQTVLSIYLWVSCTWIDPQGTVFTWIIAILVWVSLSSSFSLVMKSTGGLPGKPDKAGTGTSCHCSPRIPVTFTTWAGGMDRLDAYFWDSRGSFPLALRCYQCSFSLWLYKLHALA